MLGTADETDFLVFICVWHVFGFCYKCCENAGKVAALVLFVADGVKVRPLALFHIRVEHNEFLIREFFRNLLDDLSGGRSVGNDNIVFSFLSEILECRLPLCLVTADLDNLYLAAKIGSDLFHTCVCRIVEGFIT